MCPLWQRIDHSRACASSLTLWGLPRRHWQAQHLDRLCQNEGACGHVVTCRRFPSSTAASGRCGASAPLLTSAKAWPTFSVATSTISAVVRRTQQFAQRLQLSRPNAYHRYRDGKHAGRIVGSMQSDCASTMSLAVHNLSLARTCHRLDDFLPESRCLSEYRHRE